MPFIRSEGSDIIQYPLPHDPQESLYYSLLYRPPIWSPSTEYIENRDFVSSSMPTGFIYFCIDSGISGSSEPDFINKTGKKTLDNLVSWKSVSDNSFMKLGDTIVSSGSVWRATTLKGVIIPEITLDDSGIVEDTTYVRVSLIPENIKSFLLTNTVTILREFGGTEIIERSILIPIKQL